MPDAMNSIGSEQVPSAPLLSAEERQGYESMLWDTASRISELKADLQNKLDDMYAGLSSADLASLNLHQQELRAHQEVQYWKLHRQLQELCAGEEALASLLEGLETGTVAKDDLLPFLPTEEPSESKKLSKKRQAMAKAERFTTEPLDIFGELALGGIGVVLGPRTDPRRITTGRNAQKLVSASGIPSHEAEYAFLDATADTHGGKVRQKGKTPGAYVGKSGKRIRKR